MSRLNVYAFEHANQYYFFDVNRNRIFSISKDTYNALEEGSSNKHLEYLKTKGYLSTKTPGDIVHPDTSMVESLLNRNLPGICLQVTQSCNFRCKYCVYAETDLYDVRSHSSKKMSWNTAKKAIDFLINHSQDSYNINVAFYGGEPLLEFDLIKRCMEYLSTNSGGKSVTFTMTTNGSLLNEKVINEFLKYKTKIAVSLDGPQKIHDKNRVYAHDKGTFDDITQNIRLLCKKFPEIKENLSYSMVLDPQNSFSCIDNFVEYDDELFDGTMIMSSLISKHYRNDSLKYSEEFISEWQYAKFKYMLYLIDKLSDKYNSRIMKVTFMEIINLIKSLRDNYEYFREEEHHSGPCVPGQLRLFINTDGEFYPCEKVSEKSKVMNIGNLEEGFYFEKIKYLLNIGRLTEEECKHCYAIRNCDLCAIAADTGSENEEKLSRKMKLVACDHTRKKFDDRLKDICALQRCGFKLDKYMEV